MEATIEYEGTINGTEFNSTIHDEGDESIDWEPRVSFKIAVLPTQCENLKPLQNQNL